jgi:hypothetical protein
VFEIKWNNKIRNWLTDSEFTCKWDETLLFDLDKKKMIIIMTGALLNKGLTTNTVTKKLMLVIRNSKCSMRSFKMV